MRCVDVKYGLRCVGLMALLILASARVGWAWGPGGHIIVAHLAEIRLQPAVLTIIRNEFNIKHLADVAKWADDIKKLPGAPDALHYTNIAEGSRTYNRERDCPHGRCVTEKIKFYSDRLRDTSRPKSERIEALKFLVHFVADAHQPMHMGNARDRGGNEIPVQVGEDETNLHALWDSGLIVLDGQSLVHYARSLEATLTPEKVEGWAGGPDLWTNESRALVLDYGYPLLKDGQGRLTSQYIQRGQGVVEVQLMKGGVRLAHLLNTILQPSIGSTP